MYGLVIQLRAFFCAIIFVGGVCFCSAGHALVISQIYGGGGNSGSLFTNDFIEIFNNSTSVADLSGFSVQYASRSATAWHKTDLSGTLDPYHYYLIQEAGGSSGTTPLPTPDKIDTIGLSASTGNIALVSTQSLLPSSNACLDVSILDLVGYGSAVCYEGSAATLRPLEQRIGGAPGRRIDGQQRQLIGFRTAATAHPTKHGIIGQHARLGCAGTGGQFRKRARQHRAAGRRTCGNADTPTTATSGCMGRMIRDNVQSKSCTNAARIFSGRGSSAY